MVKKSLFVFLILFFAFLFFGGRNSKAYACTTDEDCSDNQYCDCGDGFCEPGETGTCTNRVCTVCKYASNHQCVNSANGTSDARCPLSNCQVCNGSGSCRDNCTGGCQSCVDNNRGGDCQDDPSQCTTGCNTDCVSGSCESACSSCQNCPDSTCVDKTCDPCYSCRLATGNCHYDCTGNEYCDAGNCVAPAPVICTNDGRCNSDGCSAERGTCQSAAGVNIRASNNSPEGCFPQACSSPNNAGVYDKCVTDIETYYCSAQSPGWYCGISNTCNVTGCNSNDTVNCKTVGDVAPPTSCGSGVCSGYDCRYRGSLICCNETAVAGLPNYSQYFDPITCGADKPYHCGDSCVENQTLCAGQSSCSAGGGGGTPAPSPSNTPPPSCGTLGYPAPSPAVCSANGTQATLNWGAGTNANFYSVGIDAAPNSFNLGDCNAMYEGDYCFDWNNSPYTFTVTPGVLYDAWIHSRCLVNWTDPGINWPTFSCLVPTATLTPTPILCPTIVSAGPDTAVIGDPTDFSITYSHSLGASYINRGYFGLTNLCSNNPGEGGCGNFEHQLSQSLAAFYVAGPPSWGGVGTDDTNAACSGNVPTPTCPWGYFPDSPLPLYNPDNTAKVNSVTVSDNGNNRTFTWNVTLNSGFPQGTYYYYGMVRDTNLNYQSCLGNQWDRLTQVTVTTPTPSPTQVPTATPTPGPWTKIKFSSFSSTATTMNNVPASATAYDVTDDTTQAVFILGTDASGLDAGAALGIQSNNRYSTRGWYDINYSYSKSTNFPPIRYLDYVRSRKEYVTKTNIDDIEANKINIFTSNNPVTIDTDIANAPAVIIFTNNNLDSLQEVTINLTGNIFNGGANPKSLSIIAAKITFSDSLTEANGIFIADTIDVGSTTDQGLKIKGNLIAQTAFTNSRTWSVATKPTVFIIRDMDMYLDLLPYLSIDNYEWRQLQ